MINLISSLNDQFIYLPNLELIGSKKQFKLDLNNQSNN